MEPSINTKKVKAMKKYKMAKFAYNLALYSLTSIITCFFFSSPFWFPSITNHLLIIVSSFSTPISFCYNAKFFFLLGNLIVIILVGDSKLKQSPTSDFYDEYVARSRSIDGYPKTLIVEEKINHHEDNKEEIKLQSIPRGEEKKKGMRSCKSEVWGEKAKKEEGEKKIKMGMRSSKSAVWSEGETIEMEKGKGKKEEQSTRMDDEEKKLMGMRSSKMKGKKEEQSMIKNVVDHQEKDKMGMRSSKSAVWGESEIAEREKGEGLKKDEHEEKKKTMGMRSCRSEIWSESEIKRLGKTHVAKEEEEQQLNVFNKRVEDFIARVNKQRLLEAKIVDHIKGS